MAQYLQLHQTAEPAVSEATKRYLTGLSAWIRGNLDWSMNSPRYHRHGEPTIAVSSHPTRPLPPFTPPPGVTWWWSRTPQAEQPASEEAEAQCRSSQRVLANVLS